MGLSVGEVNSLILRVNINDKGVYLQFVEGGLCSADGQFRRNIFIRLILQH